MIQLQQDIKSKIKVFFNETRNHLTVTAYPAISLIINHLPLQSHFRKARAPTTAIDSYFLGRSSMGSRADIGRYTVQRCATIYIHTHLHPRGCRRKEYESNGICRAESHARVVNKNQQKTDLLSAIPSAPGYAGEGHFGESKRSRHLSR